MAHVGALLLALKLRESFATKENLDVPFYSPNRSYPILQHPINSFVHFRDCYWDACGDEKDNDKNQCAHYAYVARQCRKHGVLIPKWREMLKCREFKFFF